MLNDVTRNRAAKASSKPMLRESVRGTTRSQDEDFQHIKNAMKV